MSFCLFLEFGGGAAPAAPIAADDDAKLLALLRTLGGLGRAHVYTPASAHDPFLHDGAPPRLALQLYFARIDDLEAAAARSGPLQALASDFSSLAGAPLAHEAMLVRRFAVPEPAIAQEPWCTYLVAYEGPAEDPNAWHDHYIAHHPAIMVRLPGIRELEIYTGVETIDFLPGERVRHLQRNKVAFDSALALTAALESPLRAEMRADYKRFPRFSGRVTHFPMTTRAVYPESSLRRA